MAGLLPHCWGLSQPRRGLEVDLLGDCHSSMYWRTRAPSNNPHADANTML